MYILNKAVVIGYKVQNNDSFWHKDRSYNDLKEGPPVARKRVESLQKITDSISKNLPSILIEAQRIRVQLRANKEIKNPQKVQDLLEKINAIIDGNRILQEEQGNARAGNNICLAIRCFFTPSPNQKLIRISKYIQKRLSIMGVT